MHPVKPIATTPDEKAENYLKCQDDLAQKKKNEDLDTFEAAIRAKAARLMREARAGLG